jgi:hypothetical protein
MRILLTVVLGLRSLVLTRPIVERWAVVKIVQAPEETELLERFIANEIEKIRDGKQILSAAVTILPEPSGNKDGEGGC